MSALKAISLALTVAIALCVTFYAYRAVRGSSSHERMAWISAAAWSLGAALNSALNTLRLP